MYVIFKSENSLHNDNAPASWYYHLSKGKLKLRKLVLDINNGNRHRSLYRKRDTVDLTGRKSANAYIWT